MYLYTYELGTDDVLVHACWITLFAIKLILFFVSVSQHQMQKLYIYHTRVMNQMSTIKPKSNLVHSLPFELQPKRFCCLFLLFQVYFPKI
uniref:Uncharacterized protein n=1 Tax=Manihot esculenta TaxID=3983 RepID=A0A2C9WFA2_MANES